jgi:hypothetical protein
MDTATATALLEITETSREALRHEEPGAEAPVEARYADILEALGWLLTALNSRRRVGWPGPW